MIVGLGNPGSKYDETRHNIGFMVIDEIARREKIEFSHEKYFEADVATSFINGEKVFLVKPTTFMNASGKAVQALIAYYGLVIEDLLVVYDDLDMEIGKIRLRQKGSAGGHNGMKSIFTQLATQEFKRLKVGIGRPKKGVSVIHHVLGKFDLEEKIDIDLSVDKAVTIVHDFIDGKSFDILMQKYNG